MALLKKSRPVFIGAALTVCAFAAAPLTAQQNANQGDAGTAATSAQSSGDPLDALRSCQAIAAPEQRLACYDRSVGAIVSASDRGEVKVVDKASVEKARRGLFGFSVPSLKLFGDDKDGRSEKSDDILQSTIKSVSYRGDRALTFTIEEGDAVWQIRSVPRRLRKVKPGDPVEFKKAALGSYFIRIDGQTGVKGRRIQ